MDSSGRLIRLVTLFRTGSAQIGRRQTRRRSLKNGASLAGIEGLEILTEESLGFIKKLLYPAAHGFFGLLGQCMEGRNGGDGKDALSYGEASVGQGPEVSAATACEQACRLRDASSITAAESAEHFASTFLAGI